VNRKPETPADPASFTKKDLLDIESLSKAEIQMILDTAESMAEINKRTIKKVPTLRGRLVANLFYENSTRTRFSFEIAERRLQRGVHQLEPVHKHRVARGTGESARLLPAYGHPREKYVFRSVDDRRVPAGGDFPGDDAGLAYKRFDVSPGLERHDLGQLVVVFLDPELVVFLKEVGGEKDHSRQRKRDDQRDYRYQLEPERGVKRPRLGDGFWPLAAAPAALRFFRGNRFSRRRKGGLYERFPGFQRRFRWRDGRGLSRFHDRCLRLRRFYRRGRFIDDEALVIHRRLPLHVGIFRPLLVDVALELDFIRIGKLDDHGFGVNGIRLR